MHCHPLTGHPQHLVGAQPPLLLDLGNPPLRFAVSRVATRIEGLARWRARRAHRDRGRPEEQAKRARDLALVGGRPRRAWRKRIGQGNTRPGAAAFSQMGNGCTQALYPTLYPSSIPNLPGTPQWDTRDPNGQEVCCGSEWRIGDSNP